jgi:hypothetical protein
MEIVFFGKLLDFEDRREDGTASEVGDRAFEGVGKIGDFWSVSELECRTQSGHQPWTFDEEGFRDLDADFVRTIHARKEFEFIEGHILGELG